MLLALKERHSCYYLLNFLESAKKTLLPLSSSSSLFKVSQDLQPLLAINIQLAGQRLQSLIFFLVVCFFCTLIFPDFVLPDTCDLVLSFFMVVQLYPSDLNISIFTLKWIQFTHKEEHCL